MYHEFGHHIHQMKYVNNDQIIVGDMFHFEKVEQLIRRTKQKEKKFHLKKIYCKF